MILYAYDSESYFAGTIEIDPMGKVPSGTLSPPPILVGAEVARWDVDHWTVLSSRPAGEPQSNEILVPNFITPRQGYIILSRYELLEPVRAYFAALEGQEGEEAKIELEFAQEWKRTWPTLINAAHDFGLTDAQIDQMFIEASII